MAFGMLIPQIEGFRILGTLFSSSLFPQRAPEGHVTLTSYVGGTRAPELADRPEAELARIVIGDLERILGIRGAPTFRHQVFYPRAIPQYNVGYGGSGPDGRRECRAPGLFFAGPLPGRHFPGRFDRIGRPGCRTHRGGIATRRNPSPPARPMNTKGVLLINLGSPDSPAVPDVRRYLREFLMDGRVLDAPWPIRFSWCTR
jgi:hypothetical protein